MTETVLPTLDAAIQKKLDACRRIFHELGSAAVAFSGGVDSSCLLALAAETLGTENVLAAMAVSTIFPHRERKAGREFAKSLRVELVEIQTPQLTDSNFTANPTDRCYYCKTRMLSKLKSLAAERRLQAVVTGSNASDENDFRPGLRAERQLGVRRPLLEAGLTKDDIRQASRAMNLPGWDRPAGACLASRVPYGEPITAAKIDRIGRAEQLLQSLGFDHCRVRDHGSVARIEVPAERLPHLLGHRDRIVAGLCRLGYTHVSLDLQGLRHGSMNAPIR